MRLEGIHHITAITGDAPKNVDFYARVLGLRLVKKTVNQDDPTVYHLFYADEVGSPGSDITFFEYPGAAAGGPGRAWCTGSLAGRLRGGARVLGGAAGRRGSRGRARPARLRFADPEGLSLELAVVETDGRPADRGASGDPGRARAPGLRLRAGLRASPRRAASSSRQALGFELPTATAFEARGEERGSLLRLRRAPGERGIRGAGTVHHVAWASSPEEHEAWRQRVLEAGGPTPVIDRFYFRSIYFREPSGVLFEIATIGPGFTTDEPLEHLGERLSLPPAFEHLREQVEPVLTPLPDPRARESVG